MPDDQEVDRSGGSAHRGAAGIARPAASRGRRSCARPGSGSSWPPMPTAAGSSATCTTACSSTSSRSRSTCSSRRSWSTPIPRRRKTLLDEMGRDVQQALDETAQLAQRIYPPLLEAGGLAAALRSAAASAGIPASVDVGSGRRATRRSSRRTVYWCCLEALERAERRRTRDGHGAGRGGSARLRDRRGRRPLGGARAAARPRRGARRPADDPSRSPAGGTRVSGSLPLSR